jgi:hypothetical protein
MSEIKKELERDIKRRRRMGFGNYWILNGFLFLAVICSLFPLINKALPGAYQVSQNWIPFISAIPAAVIFFLTIFKFEEKQNYHWNYARKIRALHRKLRDQNASPDEISKEYNNLTIQLGENYPGNTIMSGFRGDKSTDLTQK